MTEAQLHERRSALLAERHTTADDLRARGADYALDAPDLAALTELDNIDYLLGADIAA